MVLYINSNTRTAKGYFLISETAEDKEEFIVHNKDKKDPVKMERNRIIPTKPITDEVKKRD